MIPKNNGVQYKKRKKIHLKLPSIFEEVLHIYQETELAKHIPTCSGASANNVLALLDSQGKSYERTKPFQQP